MDKAGPNWPRCLSGQTLISASTLIKLTLAEGELTKYEVLRKKCLTRSWTLQKTCMTEIEKTALKRTRLIALTLNFKCKKNDVFIFLFYKMIL